jgi:phosphoesterase RecJ-like protein
MDNNRSLPYLIEQISKAKNIAIIGHILPDTDAIASVITLKRIIERNFTDKQVDIFADCEEVDECNKNMLVNERLNESRTEIYDLVIGVDCPNKSRFGRFISLFENASDTAQIDHHETNEFFARNNLVFRKASSTCEAICLISKLKNYELSDYTCKLIYAGIITDTANLSQGTMTAMTFEIIKEFRKRNIDLDAINEHFFKNNTKEKMILLERAIHSIQFIAKDKIAIMRLKKSDFTESGATYEDTYGLINYAINIKGVQLAMIIIDQDDNTHRISLRSKSGVNVAEIAKNFGGGGHENMAAFQYSGKMSDIKSELVKTCKAQLIKEEPSQNIFYDPDEVQNGFSQNDSLQNDDFEI